MLARWAGIAVENARLYRDADQRRGELERAVRGLEATQAVARRRRRRHDLDRVLELSSNAAARWSRRAAS